MFVVKWRLFAALVSSLFLLSVCCSQTTPPNITYLSASSGPVETVVAIHGQYFGATQGTSTVNFNGTIATPTSWSDGQVVAAVPSGATTGKVNITENGVVSNAGYGPVLRLGHRRL